MIPGFPPSVHPGDHDCGIIVGTIEDMGDGLSLRAPVQAPTNLGDCYWIVIADHILGRIFKLEEGARPKFVRIKVDGSKANPHTIAFAPIGKTPTLVPGFDPRIQLNIFEENQGKYLSLEWDATAGMLDYKMYSDDAQLSGWNLSGLRRLLTGRPVNQTPTEMQLDVEIITAGGVHTVILSLNGYNICSGSRTGDGQVNFYPLNGSGVSGPVNLTYSGDIALGGAYLAIRWPKSYQMYVDNVLAKTVQDNGLGNRFTARVGPKAAGTYSMKVRGVSDTNAAGTFSTPINKTISTRPFPPGVPVYHAGGAGWGTNLLTAPADMTDPAWVAIQCSAVANDALGPDGLMSADTVTVQVGGSSIARKVQTKAETAGNVRTVYGIFKLGSLATWVRLAVLDTNGVSSAFREAYWNLSTGAAGTVSGVTALSAVAVGNGYWRLGFTYTASYTGNHEISFMLAAANNGGVPVATGGYMLVQRVQMVSGATDYFPTVISFAASATVAATYASFESELDAPINLNVVVGSLPAGTGTLYLMLAELAGTPTGKRLAVVEALDGGLKDGFERQVSLEYLLGVIVPPRPNIPIYSVESRDGLTLNVTARYDSRGEKGTGVTAKLYVFADGEATDFTTADDSEALSSADDKGWKTASLAFAVPSVGLYRFCVRIADAAGTLSPNTRLEGEAWLSDAVLGASTEVAGYVSG